MALLVDWPRIAALAKSLELSFECEPAKAFRREDGQWQVSDTRSLEKVIAHALLDRHVDVECVSASSAGGIHLDSSMLYRAWPEAYECFTPSASLGLDDGWEAFKSSEAGGGRGLLDPKFIMCSRDAEPVCWPKAWHFARKAKVMDAKEVSAAFGEVPVRWVEEVQRWSAGNRHRLTSARLNGRALGVRIASKSRRPLSG